MYEAETFNFMNFNFIVSNLLLPISWRKLDSNNTRFVFYCVLSVVVVFINCLSARISSFCINFFTVAKLLALVIIIVVGIIELCKG